ncbi:hypothetical protein [Halocatena marina]|uniref:Uncharacterized protein n=1 Tax=Halocatena marina TaxID=2934937 RepID=A0ABD5YLA7_9EURY|nr:hypothetical protein [Halocatena marina]
MSKRILWTVGETTQSAPWSKLTPLMDWVVSQPVWIQSEYD